MGLYEYVCQHTDCKRIAEGIRECRKCGRVIITNRGVDKRNE
ncbi:hypothetical protein LCGC14_1620480 [marine sediment metagenome]|uniref:Uncharacterized protein n=1 Tax=marine sediment metagenome TaxID=412755 RepID=A0A0F9I5P2_9ZZZZ